MKVSELIGRALDWAVAKAEGFEVYSVRTNAWHYYSTDWSRGGPIIEREIGNLWKDNKLYPSDPDVWTAASYVKNNLETSVYYAQGCTPLIAAMRCFVASKLGDEIEIPKELA